MSIHYKLLQATGAVLGASRYRTVVIDRTTVGMQQLRTTIQKATTLTATDLTAALDALTAEIRTQLLAGNSVRLDGLGYFSAVVAGEVCEDVRTGHRRLRQPRVRTVRFRPEKGFVRQFHEAEFANATSATAATAPSSAETAAAVRALFERRPVFTVRELQSRLRLSRIAAYRLVARLEADGTLRNVGTPYRKLLAKGGATGE